MEDGLFSMVRLDDPTYMVRFLKNHQFTKHVAPSLGVKPNVGQEE